PWSAPLAYALQGIANGGEVRRNCEVRGGAFEDGIWRLQTNCGSVEASAVINCAGLFGDLVEGICRESHFTIKPRKGQFIVFDKAAAGLVNATILPLANKYTKGVLVGRTVFGNLVLGPTAEEQEDRETAAVDGDVLKKILALGLRMVPALAKYDITATYAGLRPATQFSDYQIEALPERKWITVAGIRSSGLTGS